jgi:hypothetical protein
MPYVKEVLMRHLFATILAASMALPALSHASVIDFNNGREPGWGSTNLIYTRGSDGDNGFGNMVQRAGGAHAVNEFGVPHASFFLLSLDTFTLNSMLLAGGWGSQTLHVEGINNGEVLYSRFVHVTTTPQELLLHWQGIDFIRIATGDDFVRTVEYGDDTKFWVMDNWIINEAVPVPAPAPLALFALGVLALVAGRRRRI